MQVSKSEFARLKAMARKAKRAERVSENRLLGVLSLVREDMGVPDPSKQARDAPRRIRKPKSGPSARRAAFNRLAAICRTFVLLRCKWTHAGKCEIAMACGGEGEGGTWYHGWPQKGGNGLKYDSRSHFASCNPCNMGEYGARMNGSLLYVNRHKELLGAQWDTLNALHGRRQISTKEAMGMSQEFERRISMREWD